MEHATWRCDCGAVEAEVPVTGARLVCYCESCRAFVERLGKTERLDAAGGSDLLQVAPHEVRLSKGAEHLAWFQITPKGPLRWYTACCGTPMVNTLGSKKFPFASFQVSGVAEAGALPPISARVHLKGATARVNEPAGSVLALVLGFLGRAAKSRLTGRWRVNPFFDADGRPIAARRAPDASTG